MFTHSLRDGWENIHNLSYYHHQIGSMNYYPLFGVRSWNNGMRCMSFYILIGPIWGRQDPGGPHVGPVNLAIWEYATSMRICQWQCGFHWKAAPPLVKSHATVSNRSSNTAPCSASLRHSTILAINILTVLETSPMDIVVIVVVVVGGGVYWPLGSKQICIS